MIFYQQLDETDCGIACFATVASFYGKKINIARNREIAGTDQNGTNLKGLIECAINNSFKPYVVKGSMKDISKELTVPFIAHVKIPRNKTEIINHYIVIYSISKKKLKIWDPDPLYKKYNLTYDEFSKYWTGYLVFIEPDVDFVKTKEKENLLIKFLPIFLPHKKLLVYSFICSILLLIFGTITSFCFKYIFDEVLYSKSAFSLHTLSFGIMISTIIQNIVTCTRSIFLSHFTFKTDLQLNFSYLSHIFKLPVSFFESRKSGEILSRLGDLEKIKETFSNMVFSGVMDIVMVIVSVPILIAINAKLFGISIGAVFIVSVISVIFSKIYRSYYSKIMN